MRGLADRIIKYSGAVALVAAERFYIYNLVCLEFEL